jgi:carbamoyltransferase
MITWGLSAASHNAALAVFHDNKLVFASESERFSKIKNDPDLNAELVSYATENFGAADLVCWYEKPWLKSFRQFEAGQGWIDNNVKRYLNKFNITAPVKTVSHHRSHAAAGYYTSGFDEACVVVIDAIGEYDTLSIWHGCGNKLKKLYSISYPHSIGLFYSAMTQRCGLKPNEEEYILMGMAALGNPNRLVRDMMNDFVSYPTWDMGGLLYFKENLHRGCRYWRPDLTSQQDIYDIAAATQAVYEMLFESTLHYALKLVDSKNLVLMGGCALNCSANPIAYKYFENVWIMPAPGDSGSAIGAVLAHQKQAIDWPGVYLGYDIGYKTDNHEIIDYLLQHKICGLARGRAEFGPRALGNRSLIADPRGPEIKALINNIKHREQFRPFAPAILEEFANSYFKMPTKSTTYMQFIAPCLESESFPAVVHIDKTSRVQTVNKTDNPQFRELLEIWYAKTGCPMLLNTSLNIKGEPMVNDICDSMTWSQKYGLPVFN